jgi:transposase InsO family protein
MTVSGINASLGVTGDSYDNALAETVNVLHKSELINYLKESWNDANNVELTTFQWVDWFN